MKNEKAKKAIKEMNKRELLKGVGRALCVLGAVGALISGYAIFASMGDE